MATLHVPPLITDRAPLGVQTCRQNVNSEQWYSWDWSGYLMAAQAVGGSTPRYFVTPDDGGVIIDEEGSDPATETTSVRIITNKQASTVGRRYCISAVLDAVGTLTERADRQFHLVITR